MNGNNVVITLDEPEHHAHRYQDEAQDPRMVDKPHHDLFHDHHADVATPAWDHTCSTVCTCGTIQDGAEVPEPCTCVADAAGAITLPSIWEGGYCDGDDILRHPDTCPH